MQDKSRTWIALGLIGFLALVSYANALRGDFIWDDNLLIKNNAHIKSWGNLSQVLTSDFAQTSFNKKGGTLTGGYYRPIINLSYMLDYSLSRENTLGYHITNLVWHTACGIIIYFLVLLLFGEFELSLITSLLFIAHPIHTESVAWISGRTDVICTFFFLVSLYLYTLAHLNGHHGRNFYLGLSVISFALALISKEMAAFLPLILILIDYLFAIKEFNLRRLWDRAKSWIPYWIILLTYLIIYFKNIRPDYTADVASLNKSYRLLTIGRAVIYYLKALIYPVVLNPYIMTDAVTRIFSLEVILTLLILVGSLYLAYLMRRTSKEISFSIIFFWISIIPLSNIIPIYTAIDTMFPMAIRYLYLPSFAFCLLSAAILKKLGIIKFKRISLGAVIPSFLLLFYVRETAYANTFWQNETIFFGRALKLSPQSPSLNYFEGNMLSKMQKYDAAISCYHKSLKLRDKFKNSQRNVPLSAIYTYLGNGYYLKGNLQEALAAVQTAIKHNNETVEAAKIHPTDTDADKYYQPLMYSIAADIYFKNKDYDLAINSYLKAVELKEIVNREKTLGSFYTALSTCYYAKMDLQKAIAAAQAAITYDEKNALAHLCLSEYYGKSGQSSLAQIEFNRTLELDPSYRGMLNRD